MRAIGERLCIIILAFGLHGGLLGADVVSVDNNGLPASDADKEGQESPDSELRAIIDVGHDEGRVVRGEENELGERIGVWTILHQVSGDTVSITYEDGIMNGQWSKFDKNGTLMISGRMAKGKMVGEWSYRRAASDSPIHIDFGGE